MIVKLNKKTFVHLHGIKGFESGKTLQPGANEISSKNWKEYEKHPTIKAMIDAGEIETDETADEFEGKSESEESDMDANHIAEMKNGQAISTVKDTVNVGLLQKWLAKEKSAKKERPTVISAIEKQIELVTTPGEKRDRAATGHAPSNSGGVSADHVDLGEQKPQPGDD